MKKACSFILLACMAMVFYGCPIGLNHSLGYIGKEAIDPSLVGTWVIKKDQEAEIHEVKITRKDAYSYAVEVLEQGEIYSLETNHLTGWVTKVGGAKFFYLRPDNEELYYHYHYAFSDKNTLVIHDVGLLDGGVDAVLSTETLRAEVESSMQKEGWGSEKTEFIRRF